MKKRGLLALLFGMAVMSFTILNSCDIDIGLGSAVDTEPPVLKIENPPALAVIRDKFVINGTWTDDGSISDISIELRNTSDEDPVIYTFKGKFDDKNNWSAEINPLNPKQKIPDGKYEATIIISDNGGHHSISNRTFVIDNTKPVVILQRPSTTDNDNDADVFGQKFTLTGQAADGNDIVLVRINFFETPDCSGEPVHFINIPNVPPTIDLDVATFQLDVDNDYSKIYGSSQKDGKKRFYFTIEAYDGARRYTGEKEEDLSEEDKLGNLADYYYPYESVFKLVSQYKATGLYNILNGTYNTINSRNISTDDESYIRNTLADNENPKGRFVLNPSNNPEFKIVGRDALLIEDGKIDFSKSAYSLLNESNITLKVAMGLDSIPIIKDSLKIYMLECNDKGEVEDSYYTDEETLKRVYTNRIYPASDSINIEGNGGDYMLTAKLVAENCENYKGEKVTLKIKGTYIIGIEGYDEDNNEAEPEDGNLYGFMLAPNGTVPVVDVNLPATIYNGSNIIRPSIMIQSNQKPFTLVREVFDSDNNLIDALSKTFTKDDAGMAELSNDNPEVEDSIAISPAITASGKYKIVYTVKDKSDKEGENKKTVTVDLTSPQIKTVQISGENYDSAKWYNSKTLSVGVLANDIAGETGIDTVSYSTNGTAWTALSYDTESQMYSGSTVFGNEGATNSLYIRAKDLAGNLVYFDNLTANGSLNPAFVNVKIDSSAPNLGNTFYYQLGDLTAKESSGQIYVDGTKDLIVYGKSYDEESGLDSTKPLIFTIGETTVLPTSITYAVSEPASGSNMTGLTYGAAPSNTKTIKYWKATFAKALINSSEKCGTLKVKVKNIAGHESAATSIFNITFDSAAPVLSNVSFTSSNLKKQPYKQTQYSQQNQTVYFVNNKDSNPKFKISGIATDNCGVNDVTLKIGTTNITRTSTSLSEWVFDDIDLSAYAENEVQTAVVTVSDLTGNSASSSFIIKFDVTNPKAMHWADAKNKDIYFRFGSSDNDKDESGTSWETGDAVNSTNASFNEDVGKKYSYGSWGNDSTIEIRGNFYEAESGSGLKAIHYAIFDEVPTEEQILKLLDGTLVKSGSVKVVNTFAPLAEPVVKKVPYNKNTTGAKSVKEVISNFRTTLSGFDSDSNYLVLVAEDNVGNRALDTLTVTEGTSSSGENVGTEISDGTSSWNSENHNTPTAYYNINKDTQAPVISSDAINLYTNGEGDNIELSGTAFDALSGLSNVTVTIEELNFNQRAELNNGSWSTTIPVSYFNDASVTTGRSYSVYAKATDNAGIGNSKQVSAGTIIIDKTAPVAKINTSASITKDTVTLSGTVNDGTGAGLSDEKLILYYTKSSSLGSVSTAPASITIGTNPADAATKWVELAQINSAADWSYNAENITSITNADENTTLYFTFAAKDASGTGNTGYAKPCSILVDRKKPELKDSESGIGGKTGLSDISNFWFNTKTLRLEGEYSDVAGSGVTTISYNINNASQTTNIQTTDGSYSINISDFVDGSNTLKIWATDKAGNVSTETTYSFNVDSIAPVITSITGADTTKESDVNLIININDENPIVPEVKLKRANTLDYLQTLTASAPVASGSIYTSTVTVPFADAITDDGIYDIDVISKDKAGNTSAVFTKRIVRDHVAPTITITKPDTESAGFTKYANYKFEGTITDVTSGISEATATLCTVTGTSSEPIYTPVKDAETISPDANGNWVFQAYELGAADYVIKVNAKDIANNAAVEKISYIVKIDSEPPVLTVSASGLNDSDGNVATTLSNGVTYYAKGNYSIDVIVDDFNYEYATSGTYSNLTTITATDSNNADVEYKEIEPETTENNKTKLKIEPKYGSDGLFTYKIAVKDKADNTANPVTIKVQKDLTGPTIEIKSPAADITDPEKSLDADNYLFRINVSDGIGVGVAKLFYAFTQSDSEPAADSSEWVKKLFSDGDMILDMSLNSGTSTTINDNGELTSLCEGSWHLYAKAIDKAGNETASVVSKAFLIDKAAPVVKESMITPYVKKTSANNGKVTLGGSITESHGVNSFKVTRGTTVYEIVKNGSVQTVPAGSSYSWTYTSSGSDITWILNDYPGDGEYAYRIEAEDLVGRTTTVEKNVTVDTSVPTVSTTESLFTVPTANQSEGDLFKFEGKTGSVVDVGSGLDKVELAFTSSNTTEPTAAQISVTPSPTGVWASTVEFTNTEFSGVFNSQGKKYLWVKAYDKAENASEWTNVKSFNYDKASPSIETKLDSDLITESTKQVKTSAYEFKFKPSDSCALAESEPYTITVKKNSTLLSQGENGYTVSTTADSEGFYTVEITGNAAGDGTYEYSITANDWAEKTTSVTRIVQLDSQAPVLAVITPDLSENAYQNSDSSITVKGSSTDDSGTSAVYYMFNDSAGVPSVPTSETTKADSWTKAGWEKADGTTSWEIKISDLSGVEGKVKYLYLAAVDANGLVSTVTTGYIKVDTANPTSDTATNALITNDTVTLTGTAWDKNAIKSIKISYSDSDGTKTYSTDDANSTITLSGSPGTLAGAVSADTKVTWTKTFAVGLASGAIADDNYTFTITVEDKAGKQSIKTREVTIDTTVPTISTKKVDNDETNGAIKVAYKDGLNDWYNTNQIPVIVTLDGDLSGISSVQVSSKLSTDGKSLENPTSLILSDGKWKGNVTCETQGLNNIYIKATDAAGNSNEISISNAIPVYIDTVAPQAPIFLGAELLSHEDTSISKTPANEITSLLVNPSLDNKVTVYAALIDEGNDANARTGIADSGAFKQRGKNETPTNITNLATITVFTPAWAASKNYAEGNVVKNGSALYLCKTQHLSDTTFDPTKWTDITNYSFWSYTIPTSDMTNGGINFTVKDKATNTADYVLFQMVVDSTAPSVEIKSFTTPGSQTNLGTAQSPNLVYDVNGKITISGSASDNNKLDSVKLEYQKAGTSSWTVINQTSESTPNSWIAELDTTALTDNTKYTIRATATDAAGNSKTATQDIYINQDTDRPVITVTNPSSLADLVNGNAVTWEMSEISGTVSDDDTITYFGYYVGDSISYTATEYTQITISNGIWKISNLEDKSNKVFFKITAGDKNYFANTSTTYGPATIYDTTNNRGTYKLTDGTNRFGYREGTSPNYTTTKNEFDIVIDTVAPDVETAEYSIDGGNTWQTGLGSVTLGGALYNKLKIRQSAWDDNVVKYMSVKVIETINGVDSETPLFNETYSTLAETPYVPEKDEKGNGKTYLIFTTNEINLSNWTSTYKKSNTDSNAKRVEITMSDGIKQAVSKLDLTIDNTPPVITFTSPESGSINSGEITVYGTTNEIGNIYYTVSTSGTVKPSEDKALTGWTGYTVSADGSTLTPKNNGTITGTIKPPAYVQIPNAGVSWYVYFDGVQNDATRAHAVHLKNYATTLGVTTNLTSFTDLVNFYIWIKIEDSVGNTEEYSYPVCVDPQGDRPSISLSNPEEPDPQKGAASVGGTVKLYGTADDSNGTVDSVWVQLLSAKNGSGYGAVTQSNNVITAFAPTASDVTFWLTNGYSVYYIASQQNPVELKLSTNTTNTTATVFNSSTHTPANCYIKANFSGSQWNLKINNNGEFDPVSTSDSANDMAVRVYARDNDNNMSYPVTRYFKMDKDTPVISNVMLKQYTGNNVAASQEVRSGMFVKGTWYLEFTASDNVELDSIVFADSESVETQIPTTSITKTSINEWSVKYELPTGSGVGSFKRVIRASDKTNHTGTYDIDISYDNEAPKLLIDSSNEFDIASAVRQNNGFYKLYSKVSDESSTGTPSGVKGVGFYFMRRKAADEGLIYDPLQKRADPISTNDLTYSDGLYWMSGSVTCDDSGAITLSTDLVDKKAYVHAGSYIKLKGVMYKITSVNDTVLTIAESHENVPTAQIALAQFVDNRKSEYEATTDKDSNTGYYTSIKNDDSDSMVEELGGTSAVSSWQGSIVSRNIPDGPIEIHYTAFDESLNYALGVVGNKDYNAYKAYTTDEAKELKSKTLTLNGNYASYVYTFIPDSPAYISNNAPRLAGVHVAVDYTGSGNLSDATITKFYNSTESFLESNGSVSTKPTTVVDNLVAANKTTTDGTTSYSGITRIKGKTWLIPEMVGGNGKLWYTYNIYSSGANGAKSTTSIKSTTNATYFADGSEDFDEYKVNASGSSYVTSHTVHKGSATEDAGFIFDTDFFGTDSTATDYIPNSELNAPTWFDITIYDSTETPDLAGTAPVASTSLAANQKAIMSVALAVQIHDEVDPNVVINPFYWTSATNNSLYQNSSANGHIELENDWIQTDKYKNSGSPATSGVYDADPKVSGKIKIEGYAYDNIRLNQLKLSVVNTSNAAVISNSKLPNGTIAAIYGTSWSDSSTQGTVTDLVKGSLATDGWEFFVSDSSEDGAYNGADGHKVKWTLNLDTSKITGMAASDITVKVEAVDKASKSSTARTENTTATTDADKHKPNYKIDVVPYITDVKRNSGYNTHRSGMGNYPMMREEVENSVTGFNLGTTSSGRLYIASTSNAVTGTSVEDLTVSGNTATFTIPAAAVDGYLQYCIHISNTVEIPALNNMNNNAAYTKEEGDTRWYDDRFVRIWQCNANDKFAASYPTYPAMAMGSNGDLFMSYTFYSKSVVYYNQLMSATKTQIFTAGDQPEETDIMVNGTNDVNVIYQANQHYGGGQGNWTADVRTGAGSINLYNSKAPNCDNYAKGPYWRFEGCWHNQMLQQLKNAKVATSGNNVYHTIWYDKITKAIKYSNVQSNTTTQGNTYNASTSNNNNRGYPEIGWVVLDGDADLDDIVQRNQRTTSGYNGGESNYPDNTWNNSYLNGVDGTAMYSVALSKTPAQRTTIMNLTENSTRKNNAISNNGNYTLYDYTGGNGGTTGYNADCYENVNPTSTCGEYAAICVTSDGYPVVVYYDVDNKMLKVARAISTNPKGINTANTNDGASAWRIQQVALTSGHLGNDASYVSAVIDSAGYLHIAFQNSRGELIYTRSTNKASDLSLTQGFTFNNGSVIVDTNGTWVSITVDSNNVPQIAYMANTSGYDTLKLAYPVESITALWTAATTWETMYAPMNAKSSNVKTCLVARPSGKTGGQPTTQTDSYWKTGIGFATSEDYRVMKYIGSGTKEY